MRRVFLFAFLSALFTGVSGAQQPLTVVSAANPNVGVTADSLATVFGPSISTETASAPAPPWPTMLGDISVVSVKDSAGVSRNAGILFISPSQMNIYIPPGVAPGRATVSFPVTRGVDLNIQKTAPGLFSAAGTGTGVAAATAVRVVIPSTTQWPVPVFQCDQPVNCVALPIALGVDTPVYVSLYGTGIRSANSVIVNIGGISVQPSYAGPQSTYPGLDQINFPLLLSLRGSGLVNVTVTADGVMSNAVQLSIQ